VTQEQAVAALARQFGDEPEETHGLDQAPLRQGRVCPPWR
jgi:hypothetical protein